MSALRLPAIGTLTDRVQIWRKTMVREEDGGHAVFWTPLGAAWSRVRSVTAREIQQPDGRRARMSHSVVLRFRSDIEPGDRIGFRGRNLDIVAVEDLDGRRAFLSCACTATAVLG